MANFEAHVTSYESAREFWEHSKTGKIAHNTYIARIMTTVVVFALVYHKTAVVTFNVDDTIRLNTDGWQTSTTKQRISECLPPGWSIWQTKGDWFIGHSSPQGRNTYHFEDNMLLHPKTGKVTYPTFEQG